MRLRLRLKRMMTMTTKMRKRKRKVFCPPLSIVSQADRERREQRLKKSAGSVGGELSDVFRSAYCAVPWDTRKGRARGLLSSMLSDFKLAIFYKGWLFLKFETE